MSRRSRSRRVRYYREEAFPTFNERGASLIQDASRYSSDFVEDLAAPAVVSIRRSTPVPELESQPAGWVPAAVSWLDYPPIRATVAQEPRRVAPLKGPSRYSLASLLRPFYRVPEATKVCVRRKQRREVIFARTGGGGGMPPRRRTEESNYTCR